MMNPDAVITEFQARQATKKADSTALTYSHDVQDWAEWLQNPGLKDYDPNTRDRDAKELWEAKTADLRVYLRHLVNHGNYAGGTVNNRVAAISTFYQEVQDMAEEGYNVPSVENPTEDLDVSDWQSLKNGTKKEQELKEVYYLEPDEIEELAAHAPSPTLRNELLIRLLYQSGLRRKELAETRLEDVDTDERAIKVRSTKTYLNRTVYYQPTLDTLMSRWINVERKALATAGSEYLFPTYKTDQITPKQVNRTVRKAAEAAGLQAHVYTDASGQDHVKVTAHVLRHSFAVQSLKNGMDTRTLQKLMGHSKIETTEKYLRLAKDDVRAAARKYGAGSE